MINKAADSGSIDPTHPMAFLLSEEFNLPNVGETRKGRVLEHRNNEILVDIGAKSEGVIPASEMQSLDEETLERLAAGTAVTVYIVDTEDRHGNIIVSYLKAAAERDWEQAEALQAKKEILKTKIIGQNKGGLLVKLGQLRGFVPNSQIARERRNRNAKSDQSNSDAGKPISVKVIEVDRKRNRLILSERAAAQALREAKRGEILAKISEGDTFDGQVINLAHFGAFVDIGGVEGLVHLSELSWKRVTKPEEVLQVGDEVKVQVLSVDQDRERLALSIKQLQPDPWTMIDEIYSEGQLIEATVTKITKYGAFARIHDDYELEGLIHISEMAESHVNHPTEIVEPKQKVAVRIIRVDPEQRQLGLSIKEVSSDRFVESDLEMLSAVQE